MTKSMLIDASHPEETRVVVIQDHQLEDFDFAATASARTIQRALTTGPGNYFLYVAWADPTAAKPAESIRVVKKRLILPAATTTAMPPATTAVEAPPSGACGHERQELAGCRGAAAGSVRVVLLGSATARSAEQETQADRAHSPDSVDHEYHRRESDSLSRSSRSVSIRLTTGVSVKLAASQESGARR